MLFVLCVLVLRTVISRSARPTKLPRLISRPRTLPLLPRFHTILRQVVLLSTRSFPPPASQTLQRPSKPKSCRKSCRVFARTATRNSPRREHSIHQVARTTNVSTASFRHPAVVGSVLHQPNLARLRHPNHSILANPLECLDSDSLPTPWRWDVATVSHLVEHLVRLVLGRRLVPPEEACSSVQTTRCSMGVMLILIVAVRGVAMDSCRQWGRHQVRGSTLLARSADHLERLDRPVNRAVEMTSLCRQALE